MDLRRVGFVILAALAVSSAAMAQTWTHIRGTAANNAFVDVATLPAVAPEQRVIDLGGVAPGVSPVIGPDGALYLPTQTKEVRAFLPDGRPKWRSFVPESGRSSAAVGTDGSIYVLGTVISRDQRQGRPGFLANSKLYRLNSAGLMIGAGGFPPGPSGRDLGFAPVAPVVWRYGSKEAVLVLTRHALPDGKSEALLIDAFAPSGRPGFPDDPVFLHAREVARYPLSCLTVGCQLVGGSRPESLAVFNRLTRPLPPGIGLFLDTSGSPTVVVSDDQQSLIGYNFSPATGFTQAFKQTLPRPFFEPTTPLLLADGHSAAVVWNGPVSSLRFSGPHPIDFGAVTVPFSRAPATLLPGGDLLTVSYVGGVARVRTTPNRSVVQERAFIGDSLVGAAASRSHVFVSTKAFFYTLDATSLEIVGTYSWTDGGQSSPVIGPDGRVYAVAGGVLYVFPAPPARCPPGRPCQRPDVIGPLPDRRTSDVGPG